MNSRKMGRFPVSVRGIPTCGACQAEVFPSEAVNQFNRDGLDVGQFRVLALYLMRRFAEKKRCDNA